MAKLYLDTNIIIYAIGDSKNLFGKDISSSARKLLFEASKCKHYIIISDWTLKELELKNKLEDASFLLELLKKKTINIKKTEEDEAIAKEQNPNNVQDQLHCILAKKAGANYLVTRNVNDFKHCILPVIKPEQLL